MFGLAEVRIIGPRTENTPQALSYVPRAGHYSLRSVSR